MKKYRSEQHKKTIVDPRGGADLTGIGEDGKAVRLTRMMVGDAERRCRRGRIQALPTNAQK